MRQAGYQGNDQKCRETAVRRKLHRIGIGLRKSGTISVPDNLGGYMLVNLADGSVIIGMSYDLELEDAERWAEMVNQLGN